MAPDGRRRRASCERLWWDTHAPQETLQDGQQGLLDVPVRLGRHLDVLQVLLAGPVYALGLDLALLGGLVDLCADDEDGRERLARAAVGRDKGFVVLFEIVVLPQSACPGHGVGNAPG